VNSIKGELPAGTYRVTVDEEQIDGLSFAVWKRTGAYIEIPALSSASASRQLISLPPSELDSIKMKDGVARNDTSPHSS
jgi:hypothetical protein